MSTLVFDIETVGEKWSTLDGETQQSLVRWIDNTVRSENERTSLIEAVKDQLGFSPLTGKIVSLAAYDIERAVGVVYYVGDGSEHDYTDDTFIFKQRTEEQILEDFWESATSYDTFVTFNGRQFDFPFLLLRSVATSVKPTVEFCTKRYLMQQSLPYHVDLQEQLTFYGAMTKRPQLKFFCRAFGITGPPDEVSGDQIAGLFRAGNFEAIARHNAADVLVTTELYQRWLEYLAPRAWLNRTL